MLEKHESLWACILVQPMFLPHLTARLSQLLNRDRSVVPADVPKDIEPRPLSKLEVEWVQSILSASVGWEDADISKTMVIAEGPYTDGVSFKLYSPVPQNPHAKAVLNSFGELWIQTSNKMVMNVQLSEWEGVLQELYIVVIDMKHPRRSIRALPESWTEVSREAVGFGRR